MSQMNDSAIIDALGGTGAVAAAIGVVHNTVANWRKRGISHAGRYQIRDLAKRKHVALPEDFLTRTQTGKAVANGSKSKSVRKPIPQARTR